MRLAWVGDRDPDALRAEIERRAPSRRDPHAGRPPTSRRARGPRRASSASLPPATATRRSCPAAAEHRLRGLRDQRRASSPLSLVTAATSAAPPPSGAPPSTTARMPACCRIASASSRSSSCARPSTPRDDDAVDRRAAPASAAPPRRAWRLSAFSSSLERLHLVEQAVDAVDELVRLHADQLAGPAQHCSSSRRSRRAGRCR